jgi:hypothetical protein
MEKHPVRSKPKSKRSERGAAMLVVMLLLLVVTATATFAIQSTSVELRSSGYARQRMQSRYVAEGALAASITMMEQNPGPAVMMRQLELSESSPVVRQLAFSEPQMAGNRGNIRVTMSEMATSPGLVGAPIETGAARESLGHGMAYRPDFEVDVNDAYRFTMPIAGHRSDGGGSLSFVIATYTARGRVGPPPSEDVFSPTQASDVPTLQRRYHEAITNARAIGISGPVGGI